MNSTTLGRRTSWALAAGVAIFAVAYPSSSSSQTLKPLGQSCSTHPECASKRCDNRPGAGCVAQDGTAAGGDFCTTHQQCRSGACNVKPGTIAGTCTGNDRPLGQACVSHGECLSGRCDNRPGAGCVPNDGTGKGSDFCTTHQQCRSGFCVVPAGKIAGQCTAFDRPLGASCWSHGECRSARCDNRIGAGCVPQDGAGLPNEFCTTHQQCRSGYCSIASGLHGTCTTDGRRDGDACHVGTECASRSCQQGTCNTPKPVTPPGSSCVGGKAIDGYTFVGQPGCATSNKADHPSAYLTCDATGYYCCETSSGARTKCGVDRWTFGADCMSYCASATGNCLIGPMVRDGIFYGCYKPVAK